MNYRVSSMRDKDRVMSGTRTCDHYTASITSRIRLWNTLYSRRPRVQEKANVVNIKFDFKIAVDWYRIYAAISGVSLSSEPCA